MTLPGQIPDIRVTRDDRGRYSASLDGRPVELLEVSSPKPRMGEGGAISHHTVDITIREAGRARSFFEIRLS